MKAPVGRWWRYKGLGATDILRPWRLRIVFKRGWLFLPHFALECDWVRPRYAPKPRETHHVVSAGKNVI